MFGQPTRNGYKTWNEDMKAHFLRMANDGDYSGTNIAQEMNGTYGLTLTRNSVISICHRKGIVRTRSRPRVVKREGNARNAQRANRLQAAKARVALQASQSASLGLADDVREGINMLDRACWKDVPGSIEMSQLNSDSCRWPVCDDGGKMRYCPNANGHGAYCLAHGNLAYRGC